MSLQISGFRCALFAAQLAVAAHGFCEAAADPKPKPAIPFRVDHAAPLQAEEKPMEESERVTTLRIEFTGIAGDRVPGHLYLPKVTAGRRPAVLVQHGIGDKKRAAYIVATCRKLAEGGVIALAIDAPNRGDRQVKDQPSPSFLNPAAVQSWFRQHCGDYSRALDYLAARADVDRERLGYIGFSWGAITGITFAAHDERVRAMASIGGGGNLVGYLALPAKPGEKPVASLDPADHVAHIAPRPLLLINSTRDQLVLPIFARALHQAAGVGSEVKWFETDHFFTGVDREAILQSVADFLKAKLEAPLSKRP